MPKVVCPYCRQKAFVVKNGRRRNKNSKKQKYRCNRCKRDFTPDDGFLRMREKKQHIVEAVDLYERGLSLQKVADHMWQHHRLKVSPETIRNWVRKFSRKIKGFVSTLKPEIKGRVHADEVILKVKGEKCYYWGAKDAVTRFRLSTAWTRKREYKRGAKELFRKLKHNCIGMPPRIVTDGLEHYRRAFNKYFLYKSKLSHGVPIACKKYGLKHNNNVAERDNQRIKQRYKTMRGFKNFDSGGEILDLIDICYNFVRPHGALEGGTPAEEAGLKLNLGRNKLMSLIRLSARAASFFRSLLRSMHFLAQNWGFQPQNL
ncbi:MAG: IS6 family transposase [Candidatus Hydrothermarchaeales archaeon]